MLRARWRAVVGGAASLAVLAAAPLARAQDAAAIVARARDQIDNGSYAEGLRTLAALRGQKPPPQLVVEAALLETTALLVTQQGNESAAVNACSRAVVAAGFDPDVARELSPKVRDACRAAAKKVRGERLGNEKVKVGKLEIVEPEVAYQPVRLAATVSNRPQWLRMVARVESSGLGGTFDLPLIPSDEGPLLGTLDASWIRPGAGLSVKLVAQDRFGDLGDPIEARTVVVPTAEAAVALGEIPAGARVTVDDKPVAPDAKGRVAVSGGRHEVALRLPTGAEAHAEIEAARGAVTRVALAPQQPGPSRVGAWIATGTSVALGVAGGVLLVNSELRRSELEDAAAEREPGTDLPLNDYSTLEGIDQERKTFQYVGIGLLAGAGAVAVTATVLWLVPGARRTAARVYPIVTPAFFGLGATFF